MNGIFVECDWCGKQEISYKSKNHDDFKKFVVLRLDWYYLELDNVMYDFCSMDCYWNLANKKSLTLQPKQIQKKC